MHCNAASLFAGLAQFVRPYEGKMVVAGEGWLRSKFTRIWRYQSFRCRRVNFITGRFERIAQDELFSNDPELEAGTYQTCDGTFRIGAYTIAARQISSYSERANWNRIPIRLNRTTKIILWQSS